VEAAGALDIINGTMFGMAPNTNASPDDVIGALQPSVGEATWDTEWQPTPTEFACTGNQSYRTIWWGDLRMTFETAPSEVVLTAWSVGDAEMLAPRGPLPPVIGPATGVATDEGIGIGTPATEVTAILADHIYNSGSQSMQVVSSTGLATMLYFDGDEQIVGIGSSRNDCGEGF
jgi:hypothetical protein